MLRKERFTVATVLTSNGISNRIIGAVKVAMEVELVAVADCGAAVNSFAGPLCQCGDDWLSTHGHQKLWKLFAVAVAVAVAACIDIINKCSSRATFQKLLLLADFAVHHSASFRAAFEASLLAWKCARVQTKLL